MPAKKTLSLSETIRGQIQATENEISELQQTIAQLDAEDLAKASGLQIAPPQEGTLFAQISANIDRERAENSEVEAAKLREQLKQQCLNLIPVKQAELAGLRDRLVLADSRNGVEPELEAIQKLIDRFNQLGNEQAEIAQQLIKMSRPNLDELCDRNGWNPSPRGQFKQQVISGRPIAPEFTTA